MIKVEPRINAEDYLAFQAMMIACHLDRTSALQGLRLGGSAAECRAAVP